MAVALAAMLDPDYELLPSTACAIAVNSMKLSIKMM
jgi:hypothetical protein